MKAQDLDFTAEITHHEYNRIKIQIQDYSSDGPIMCAEVDDGTSGQISVTYEELKEMLAVFEMYNKARAILKGNDDA